MDVNSPEVAWCAGLFEGEGCLYNTNGRRLSPQHHITMMINLTDYDVLARFAAIVEGKVRGPYHNASMKAAGNRKPSWTWQEAKEARVAEILAAFWPYLGERRKERAIELGFDPLRPVTPERPCVRCGELFLSRPNARYCSRACFLEARDERRRTSEACRERNRRNAARIRERKLTGVAGSRVYKPKLTDQVVKDIRTRYAAGDISQQALADQFNVTQYTIWKYVGNGLTQRTAP